MIVVIVVRFDGISFFRSLHLSYVPAPVCMAVQGATDPEIAGHRPEPVRDGDHPCLVVVDRVENQTKLGSIPNFRTHRLTMRLRYIDRPNV